MTRSASDAQIRQAKAMAAEGASIDAIVEATGISPRSAARFSHQSRGSSPADMAGMSAESPTGPAPSADSGGPVPPSHDAEPTERTARASSSSERKRKPKGRKRTEPSADAVENTYALACIVAGGLMAFTPDQYRFRDEDYDAILRPATRLYLRRFGVPGVGALSPDVRDWITLTIGVGQYVAYIAANGGLSARRPAAGYAGPRPGGPPPSIVTPPPSTGPVGAGSNGRAPEPAGSTPVVTYQSADDIMSEIHRRAAESADRLDHAGASSVAQED